MKVEDIKTFMTDFSDALGEQKIELYSKIIESSGIADIDDWEQFHYAVIYPFEEFIETLVRCKVSDNYDVAFIMQCSHFIEINFRKMIQKYEGSVCCADKSRTIVTRLLWFYRTGKRIEFDYNGEYTYHLPKVVFTSHDDIVQFYMALKFLHYGNGEDYILALKQLFIEKKDEIANRIRILNEEYENENQRRATDENRPNPEE